MLAIVQRVSNAKVEISGKTVSEIGRGILVLLGVEEGDTEVESEYIARKVTQLRIFPDDKHHMNLSVSEIQGEILIVSQFTLLGNCRKGRRPSVSTAAEPAMGNKLYEHFAEYINQLGVPVRTGQFGAMMDVSLTNDGPVTLIVDSRRWTGQRVPIQ